MSVAFFIETREGKVRNISFEAAAVARRIAGETGLTPVGIAVGSGCAGDLEVFGEYGIPEVVAVDHPDLAFYTPEAYTAAVVSSIKNIEPAYVVMTASAMGKDLAARCAARLDIELLTDIIDFTVTDKKIEAVKPVFAGKARITVTTDSPVQFIAPRPKVFRPEKESVITCSVTAVDFDPSSVSVRARTVEVRRGGSGKVDLTEADIIVSGGRGLQDPAHFTLVENLAEALGGVVGASRAAVDAGWRMHSDQVGQTGKTVTPGLYIAVGISGAIQHLAGMSSSKYIVAINKDPDAPIFKIADYGIVGDLFDIVPALTEALKTA